MPTQGEAVNRVAVGPWPVSPVDISVGGAEVVQSKRALRGVGNDSNEVTGPGSWALVSAHPAPQQG
eukprot:7905788-Alexandrium_andersonii.AAC.1